MASSEVLITSFFKDDIRKQHSPALRGHDPVPVNVGYNLDNEDILGILVIISKETDTQ